MITTVSLNPSIDRTVTVDSFEKGALNRVVSSHSVAGGKGINVSLTAAALGVDAECIGFMFKEGSRMFEKRLMVNSTPYNFVWCEGSVRTNIKVQDRATGEITEINDRGEPVGQAALDEMSRLVSLHAENTDYLVFAGSVPPDCPGDYYRRLIENVEGMGCRCILDADGQLLQEGIEARPYMIKPNLAELQRLTGKTFTSLPEIRKAVRPYLNMGIEIVCVSMGAKGAMITDGVDAYYAEGVNIDVKSSVAAGDAMVAGLVCGCIADLGIEESLRMGSACAAARCVTEVSRVIDKTTYKAFRSMIKIEKL